MIGNGHAGFGRAASEKDPHGHLADVVPRPASDQRSARSWATDRIASPPKQSRSPGQPSSACTAPGRGSSSAPSDARSSPLPPPANSPDSPGRSLRSSEPNTDIAYPVGWVGGGPARAGNPRPRYEQPALNRVTGHARSETAAPHDELMVLRCQPANISLTARRAQHRTATHPADHTPRFTNLETEKFMTHPLTNDAPYQRSVVRSRWPVYIRRRSARNCPGRARARVGYTEGRAHESELPHDGRPHRTNP